MWRNKPRQKLTQVRIDAATSRALEAQFQARVCSSAGRRLVAEPSLDPWFPSAAISMQALAADRSLHAQRDVNRLLRRG